MPQNVHQPGSALLFNALLDLLLIDDAQFKKAFEVFRKSVNVKDALISYKSVQTRMQALVTLRDQIMMRDILEEECPKAEPAIDQKALDQLLEHVLQLLEGATKSSGNFSDHLDTAIEELKMARDMVSLKSISTSLINTSANMAAENRKFQSNLGDMALALMEQQEKIKSLEGQLEVQKQAASTDDLTGVWNRGSFDRDFGSLVEKAKRFSLPLCMLMADLDHFKHINDRHGHQAGDDVLVNFTQLLQKFMSPNAIYRYGGDEFVVLFPNTTIEKALKMVHHMDEWVGKHKYSFKDISLKLSFSAGISQFKANDDRGSFFNRVDGLLYQAKLNGRGQICSD